MAWRVIGFAIQWYFVFKEREYEGVNIVCVNRHAHAISLMMTVGCQFRDISSVFGVRWLVYCTQQCDAWNRQGIIFFFVFVIILSSSSSRLLFYSNTTHLPIVPPAKEKDWQGEAWIEHCVCNSGIQREEKAVSFVLIFNSDLPGFN